MQAILTSKTGSFKGLFAITAMTLCGALLWQHIAATPREDILKTFSAIAPQQWAFAMLATCASFMAVGRYDAVWHKAMKTDVPTAKARQTGMAAIAIGQTIGAGTITGAFVRWQLLPTLGLKTTTGISVAVSLSFLTCWAVLGVIAGVTLSLLPALALLALAVGGGLVIASIPKRLNLKIQDMGKLLALTTLDVSFAGLALWALIPDASLALFFPILAAYILALGSGLISNAPGGLGAFDLCLITLLPTLPQADLLAAILAFRIVYYLIPAIVAGGAMIWAYMHPQHASGTSTHPISDLCHQGAKLRRFGANTWVTRQHLLGSVAIEPNGCSTDLSQFKPIGFLGLYKADQRLAVQARTLGWAIRRIADDALINPQSWTASGPKMRQLRRKLSQADKAGVRITQGCTLLPRNDMDAIATTWAKAHGGELGYSMGRYDHAYIANQRTYLIWEQQTLRGFITVQTRPNNWAIDVIRHGTDMPTGAIHAAYAQIIDDAAAFNVETLSLGAVPTETLNCKFQQHCRKQKAGLIQFKQSFRPQWKPLYHAAPTSLQWTLSMLHIIWHVQRPVPRLMAKLRDTLTSLIIISPFFHLNQSRAREMAGQHFARANITKGSPHDQHQIRNVSR